MQHEQHACRAIVVTVRLYNLPDTGSVLLGRVCTPMSFLQSNYLRLRMSRHGLQGLQEFHVKVLAQTSTVQAKESDVWTIRLRTSDAEIPS